MSYTVGRNAFDIMMKVTFTLPAKINPPVGCQLRADQELHNNVMDVLQSMKVGWSRDSLSTGQAFTKALIKPNSTRAHTHTHTHTQHTCTHTSHI